MLRNILFTLTAITVVALSSFSAGQGAAAGAGGEQRTYTKEEFDAIIYAKEARIVAQLGLTPKQKKEYDALQVWLKGENAKMMALKEGHPEYGMKINRELHVRIKKVFTKAQYDKWIYLWNRP